MLEGTACTSTPHVPYLHHGVPERGYNQQTLRILNFTFCTMYMRIVTIHDSLHVQPVSCGTPDLTIDPATIDYKNKLVVVTEAPLSESVPERHDKDDGGERGRHACLNEMTRLKQQCKARMMWHVGA